MPDLLNCLRSGAHIGTLRAVRATLVSKLIAVAVLWVPLTSLADWVERQQPLAHAVYVPKNYDATRKYPLAIVIHGNGVQGNDNRAYKSEPFAKYLAEPQIQEQRPHFIYVPQCPAGQKWVGSPWESGSYSVEQVAASPSMTKLTDILKGLLKEYSIDSTRIYLLGISMGGQATWDLLCRYPGVFAGAVPMAGCGDPTKASLLKNVGIWAFHGANDPTVPVKSDREIMAGLEQAGAKVLRLTDLDPPETPKGMHIYSEYMLGHNVWDKAIALKGQVVPWLFSQSRAARK